MFKKFMLKKIVVLLSLIFHATGVDAAYRVGVAIIDLSPTPDEMPTICLAGYGPLTRCKITQVNDSITVRAISIADADSHAVFAVIDAIGVGDSIIRAIQQRVSLRSGGAIASTNIFIAATHTHSGPDLQGLWGGVGKAYRSRIIEQSSLALLSAWSGAQEANLFVANTQAPVSNRRGWPVIDEEVNILSVYDTETNDRITTLINMSAHPVIIDSDTRAYSGDYVHYLREHVEQSLGGSAVFFNGILGDASPKTAPLPTDFEQAEAFGKLVANNVITAVAGQTPVTGDFAITSTSFAHNVGNVRVLLFSWLGFLDLDLHRLWQVHIPVAHFRIGDRVEGVTFPGEAVTRLGLSLKSQMTGQTTFFLGLTGGSYGYFIPSDEFLQIEGETYEERLSLSRKVGDVTRDALLQEILP